MPRIVLSLAPLVVLVAALAACGIAPARAGASCEGPAAAYFQNERAPRLSLEVARSDQERATGLMHRDSLPSDAGMVFVFPGPTRARFWMKDTRLPLSIAFVAADGTILDIQDMAPLSLDTHGASAPYLYAIEANQGWFTANGVAPGQQVAICFGA